MFKIDSNQVIKMSKGDNIKFPLFLNKGNQICPIRYEFKPGDGCEVYFYLFNYNAPDSSPILEKTFKSDTDLWQEYVGKFNGDMKIELSPDDLLTDGKHKFSDMCEGMYLYQIKAKLLDVKASDIAGHNVYEINTVTNRHPFYIIDDDYANRMW